MPRVVNEPCRAGSPGGRHHAGVSGNDLEGGAAGHRAEAWLDFGQALAVDAGLLATLVGVAGLTFILKVGRPLLADPGRRRQSRRWRDQRVAVRG